MTIAKTVRQLIEVLENLIDHDGPVDIDDGDVGDGVAVMIATSGKNGTSRVMIGDPDEWEDAPDEPDAVEVLREEASEALMAAMTHWNALSLQEKQALEKIVRDHPTDIPKIGDQAIRVVAGFALATLANFTSIAAKEQHDKANGNKLQPFDD